ncbi:bacteriohemerythrin [Propionivibrio dicarboxylicus]|uniref:Hemerythrin-like metal-binding domain protein n=1 Tax=Propionivibrio dicarboxylicus TaxID=83767 RepID=A0A1G8AHA2_9RHOO|nr:bacteriohemerythrin [Propionivibrio dicarboxylicus]SDH20328.1 hemerythrin-like metal-binding domain protein [Propionivibrio dicarboxylicus]
MQQRLVIFPWNENFATGIGDIDFQHRRLVDLLNLLAGHLAYQSGAPTLNSILSELTDYAAEHFLAEEAIWARCFGNDEWESRHQESHGAFVAKILELQASENDDCPEATMEEIVRFLTHWLAFHIIESDKRMAKVVAGLDAGLPLARAK